MGFYGILWDSLGFFRDSLGIYGIWLESTGCFRDSSGFSVMLWDFTHFSFILNNFKDLQRWILWDRMGFLRDSSRFHQNFRNENWRRWEIDGNPKQPKVSLLLWSQRRPLSDVITWRCRRHPSFFKRVAIHWRVNRVPNHALIVSWLLTMHSTCSEILENPDNLQESKESHQIQENRLNNGGDKESCIIQKNPEKSGRIERIPDNPEESWKSWRIQRIPWNPRKSPQQWGDKESCIIQKNPEKSWRIERIPDNPVVSVQFQSRFSANRVQFECSSSAVRVPFHPSNFAWMHLPTDKSQ